MKSRFFVVLCFAFGLVRGYAQEKAEPVSFSLESAQAYALENSYEITDAQYNVSAAKARVGETRAMGLPQISADVSYQNFLNLATSLLPAQIFDKDAEPGKMIAVQFGTSQNATAGLQVNQLVFNGSYIVALRSSAAYTQMSELSLQKTKSQVKASVRQAYVAVLVSDASIHVLDSMLITTQSSLKHIEAMYKAGFIEETDAAQVRLLVSSLTTQLNSAKLQADIARKMLQYQMGIPSTGNIVLTDNLSKVLNSIDKTAYLQVSMELEGNIDYKTIKNAEHVSELLLLLEKSAYLPTLSAYFSQSYNANRNEFSFFDKSEPWYQTSVWGLKLTIPIFSGGERYYKVKRAKIELEQARNQAAKMADALTLEFTNARNTYNTAYQNYLNSIEDKKIARTIYERSVVKFEKGVGTSTDLLQNHNQYLQKETAYFGSLQMFLSSQSELERILTKAEN